MKKITRTVIKTTLLLLVIFSLLAIFIPSTSAGFSDIYSCYSVIKIEYDEEMANRPFLPIDMVKYIPMTVSYYVDGYFDEDVPAAYANMDNFIYLDIAEKPDWCTVTLSPNFLKMKANAQGNEENITLIVKVDENAHAQSYGKIGIKTEVTNMGAIKGGTFYSNMTFIPGFYPLLDIDLPEGALKKIGPLETASFDIEIDNLGNAKTLVYCEVKDVPDGWFASIDEETIIGSRTLNDNSKKTIALTVEPPEGYGYHNDREIIQVSIIPKYFDDPTFAGQEYIVYVTVQSKGLSTPGFEVAFVLIAILGFVLISKTRQKKGGKDI